jgi:hypothetical protein
MVYKITNYKSQIISNYQLYMTETLLFRISELKNWNLFDIWCLGFGALQGNDEETPIHPFHS